jgi:hypothetical protein
MRGKFIELRKDKQNEPNTGATKHDKKCGQLEIKGVHPVGPCI